MNRYGTRAQIFLLGAGLLVATGCNLTNTDPPASAYYKVTSNNPIRIITSTDFFVSGTETTPLKADTIETTAKEIDIALPSPPIFFIRAVALTPGTQVSLRVDVGKRNWYDTNRTFSPPEKLEFTYGYTGTF